MWVGYLQKEKKEKEEGTTELLLGDKETPLTLKVNSPQRIGLE